MKMLISFIRNKGEVQNPNHLIGIFDTDNKSSQRLKLDEELHSTNIVHATGMCYIKDQYLCIGLIAKEHRLKSKILTINLNTGEKKVNHLLLTKAIHSIHAMPNYKSFNDFIFCNSTQNDMITIVTMYGGEVICEDVYHDFLKQYRSKCELQLEYVFDDNYHNNGVVFDKNGRLIFSSFGNVNLPPYRIVNEKTIDFTKNKGFVGYIDNGCQRMYGTGFNMPHTPFINSKNELLICESAKFKLINCTTKQYVVLDGYTRGIAEDPDREGYWVGISAMRKYSAAGKKSIEILKPGVNLKGARLQFVSYDMQIVDSWDIHEYGNEVFDILPLNKEII